MFVPADVDLAQVVVRKGVPWLKRPAVRKWHRIMALEKIRNYKDAVARLDTLLQKYPLRMVDGFLRYLRFRETGDVLVATRDVKRLLWRRRRMIPARRAAEVLRPELVKWRILLVKSSGHALHRIARELRKRGFPTYELRKVLPR